jgi:GDP-L-fucose synthase
MTEARRVWVAGHRGMVGSAIARQLAAAGCTVITADRKELDLRDDAAVRWFVREEKVDAIYLAAARVGGILANDRYPAEFITENLQIATNVIHAAHEAGVERLLFLGSSCIYPKFAPQPIPEAALLTGPLEPTNEPYAIAKIAGIKLCESYNRQYGRQYRSVMPTNLYGPGDHYHPENSHVIPALLRRFDEARERGAAEVTIWGSGTVRREYLHVDDLAAACLHVMELPKELYVTATEPMLSHINVGTGVDVTIAELAETVARVAGYRGRLTYDRTKPDGIPRKVLDVGLIRSLGWEARIGLEEGLAGAYRWYRENRETARR